MAFEIATRPNASMDARTLALLSAIGTGTGAVCFVGAVLATQGFGYPGFVSETGVAGQPYAVWYRLGTFGFAAGLLLLAAALRGRTAALRRWSVTVALILAVAGLLSAVSGTVTCTEQCPLPPYESPTPADLVHGGASVAGVGLCALAMLLLAIGRTRTAVDAGLRRISRLTLIPVVPIGLLNAYGLALVGRSLFIGVVERPLLVCIVGWCFAVALNLARAPVRRPDVTTS